MKIWIILKRDKNYCYIFSVRAKELFNSATLSHDSNLTLLDEIHLPDKVVEREVRNIVAKEPLYAGFSDQDGEDEADLALQFSQMSMPEKMRGKRDHPPHWSDGEETEKRGRQQHQTRMRTGRTTGDLRQRVRRVGRDFQRTAEHVQANILNKRFKSHSWVVDYPGTRGRAEVQHCQRQKVERIEYEDGSSQEFVLLQRGRKTIRMRLRGASPEKWSPYIPPPNWQEQSEDRSRSPRRESRNDDRARPGSSAMMHAEVEMEQAQTSSQERYRLAQPFLAKFKLRGLLRDLDNNNDFNQITNC